MKLKQASGADITEWFMSIKINEGKIMTLKQASGVI